MGLVVISSFTKVHEAYFARNRLQTEGIESFIFDEYIVGVHPYYSNVVGGVKLLVHEEALGQAKPIIDSYIIEQRDYYISMLKRCPNCNSTNIRQPSIFSIIFFVIGVLIFGILIVLVYPKNKCNDCKHRQAC